MCIANRRCIQFYVSASSKELHNIIMDPNLRGPTHPSMRSGGLRALSSYGVKHLRHVRYDYTTFTFLTSNGSQTIGPAFQNMTSGGEKG